ncbi:hypothetical protein HU718_009590 [Pseudomonas tensinigenes]|uniref:DUF4329 domain-containing protein n=1 Tax=Pseudomonas tensinigenes TaxID=2745511 RepID=A0ABX8Q412_9PSED|nr:hypothetical protein [Pseudomonas tensinigenes]QXI07932.1 hypothetical protein HU718_009590 [Pseudomonas tensinigenes]
MPNLAETSAADDGQALSFLSSSPAFLSSDDAAACLHGLLKAPRNGEFNGFILKTVDARFICAERIDAPMADDKNQQSDATTGQHGIPGVVVSAAGELIVPSGLTLEASFHARPVKAQGADEATTEWIQRNRFFAISDLSEVMNTHRKFAKCYLSARNGGLLSYTSKNSSFEQELSPRLTRKSNGQPRRFEELYEDGSIPSSLWILLTLAAGTTTVVVTGDLWRHRGHLNASWRADILQVQPANSAMPIFGPIFRDAKDVALYLHTKLPESTAAQPNVGFILKHNVSDFFILTEPVSSPYASFDRALLFPKDQHGNPLIPREFRVHGIYHSIQPLPSARLAPSEVDLQQNFFSAADLKVSLDHVIVAPHQRVFAITRDGAVLRFAKPVMPKVRALLVELAQGLEQKLITGGITPTIFVDKVADAGILSVLFPSKTWPTMGRITASTSIVARRHHTDHSLLR